MNSNLSYSPETVKLGCDLCDLDLWPWPLAWTLPWSLVITPENFMMIRWWEHSQKGVTDRQTDVQTENTIHRAAWSQLKISAFVDEHIKMMVPLIPSYVRDTPDFIKKIENFSITGDIYLVTMDVTSLYTNIPNAEGLVSIARSLMKH